MTALPKTRQVDDIFHRFLLAGPDAEAEPALELLIFEYVQPLVKQIVRSTIRPGASLAVSAADLDDVVGDVVLRLIERLNRLRVSSETATFSSIRDYVAVSSYNASYAYLRRCYPRRSQLKSRIQYALKNYPDLALWESDHRVWLCGLKEWENGSVQPASRSKLTVSRELPANSGFESTTGVGTLLKMILVQVKQPVQLDEMVDLVADLCNVRDLPDEGLSNTDDDCRLHRALIDSVAPLLSIEREQYLQHLWREISELPIDQRLALLLNPRDTKGGDIITLLSRARVASLRDISEALEMSPEQLIELWDDLPLDDLSIARRLGNSRQQVINLRKTARKRLQNRMRRFESL